MWWDATPTPRDQATSRASSLTFLIEPRDGITGRLTKEHVLSHLFLDGPYGQNLRLENYETVLLVAKGIGIASILSYAKHLIWWKTDPVQRRRVLARKLDIYWELDDNDQEKWVGSYLKQLQETSDKLSSPLLQIWCYFPQPERSAPMITLRHDYQYIFPNQSRIHTISEAIEEVAGNTPGTSIVVACGVPTFTRRMRDAVLRKTSHNNVIEFVETEYRPYPSEPVASSASEAIELECRSILKGKHFVPQMASSLGNRSQAEEFQFV